LPIAVDLGIFELQMPGMKMLLLLLCVSAFFSVSLLAQKKARVLLNDINGKISKAEVEFIDYYENSSGDWVRNPLFEKQIFYFDNDQNLIKREDLVDYTRTDYKKKPKPTVTVTPATGYQEPVKPPRKADTSIVQTEKGEIMTLTYESYWETKQRSISYNQHIHE
jgi:hypothetical protein